MRLEQGIGAVCVTLGGYLIYSAFGKYVILLNAIAGGILIMFGISIIVLERRYSNMLFRKKAEEQKILEERYKKTRENTSRVVNLGSNVALTVQEEKPPLEFVPENMELSPPSVPAEEVKATPQTSAFDRLFQEIFTKHIQTEVDLTFELPTTESCILGKKFKVSGKIRVKSKREPVAKEKPKEEEGVKTVPIDKTLIESIPLKIEKAKAEEEEPPAEDQSLELEHDESEIEEIAELAKSEELIPEPELEKESKSKDEDDEPLLMRKKD
jgi:hypothetical protein